MDAEQTANTPRTRFTIYRKPSLSWRGNLLFFLTMACVCFTIAFAFAWQGLWLVVPFAGIEVLALGLGLYFCLERLARVETVIISDSSITVSVQQGKNTRAICALPKAWARAFVEPSHSPARRQRLCLHACRSQIEIGTFLNDAEKYQLAGAINRAINS